MELEILESLSEKHASVFWLCRQDTVWVYVNMCGFMFSQYTRGGTLHTCMYRCLHAHMCACGYVVPLCACKYVDVYVHRGLWTCMSGCIYIYVSVCMHICVCMHVCVCLPPTWHVDCRVCESRETWTCLKILGSQQHCLCRGQGLESVYTELPQLFV